MKIEQKEELINVELSRLRTFITNKRGKKFPKGKFIEGWTIHFIRDFLGYSNSPTYFNIDPDRGLAIFEEWRNVILVRLKPINQEQFNKANENGEENLDLTIKYIESM